MPDAGLLDTLVKLASLGTSGVCILAIFWIGWLIYQTPSSAEAEKHKSLRYFMVSCIIIAVVSAMTGLISANFNAERITTLEGELEQQRSEAKKQAETIEEYRRKFAGYKEAFKGLDKLLDAKKMHSPSPEIAKDVELIKTFMKEAKISGDAE
jgi:hypothetical protein